MSITVSDKELRIHGKPVATVHSQEHLDELVKSLCENLTRPSATTLVLSFLGTATTAQVADLLGMDRSNTFRYLSSLADEGRVKVVTDSQKSGTRGRPTHVWQLT
jgi:predicted ArsR family transcriptional regulator